jgi:hypothetical protein
MSKYLNRAREYHNAIRKILIDEWDPIGINHIPEAADEYDSYISGIHALLIRHESEHKIFDHLWNIETERMGLYGNRVRTEQVVISLMRLRDQLENDC